MANTIRPPTISTGPSPMPMQNAMTPSTVSTTPNTPKRLFARTAMPERCCALPRNALEKPLSTR